MNASWPKQQDPASLILGGQLHAPQDHVVGDGKPSQHGRARTGSHDLLDGPQAIFMPFGRMNHEEPVGVDSVLRECGRIRYEWRRDPGDPFLGGGSRQRAQRRHEQSQFADTVAVDENFSDGPDGPTATRQVAI